MWQRAPPQTEENSLGGPDLQLVTQTAPGVWEAAPVSVCFRGMAANWLGSRTLPWFLPPGAVSFRVWEDQENNILLVLKML